MGKKNLIAGIILVCSSFATVAFMIVKMIFFDAGQMDLIDHAFVRFGFFLTAPLAMGYILIREHNKQKGVETRSAPSPAHPR